MCEQVSRLVEMLVTTSPTVNIRTKNYFRFI